MRLHADMPGRGIVVGIALCLVTACADTPTAPVPATDAVLTASAEPTAGPSASGHTNLTIQGGLQTLSFHAREMDDGTVAGVFQTKTRAQDVTAHGALDCLNVEGNQAVVSGTVVKVNDDNPFGAEVGDTWFWAVQDNGEGAGNPDDEWTDVIALPFPCDLALPQVYLDVFGTIPVEAGNVQVKP